MSPESQDTQLQDYTAADELVAAIERLAVTLGMALLESTSRDRPDCDQVTSV